MTNSKYRAQVIRADTVNTIAEEMSRIGADKAGISIMMKKATMVCVKLKNLRRVQCNILKQHLLSAGADAAVAKGILSEEVDASDALLIGTQKQLSAALKKARQPCFDMQRLVDEVDDALNKYNRKDLTWKTAKRTFNLNKDVLIMGILNATPDSFYDGGRYNRLNAALKRAKQMIDEGADIIDVGGQSTRPGSGEIPLEQELERTIPLIEKIARRSDVTISIDTYRHGVAREALDKGASIINDITGLRADPAMARLAAERQCGLVVMHMQGTPLTMQKDPHYEDLMSEIIEMLRSCIQTAEAAGVADECIAVDPGIGFGKTPRHNYEIVDRLGELKSMGRPILVGPSRKSFIGNVLKNEPSERLLGTAAAVSACVERGASIIRVHDVREMIEVKKVICAVINRDL